MAVEKLFRAVEVDQQKPRFEELRHVTLGALNLREKNIENWVAQTPSLLFTNPEAVLVIAQEREGEPIADILALDSEGSLIIIEAKRDWSDRTTVGQVLDYAAHFSKWNYEAFNVRWKVYSPAAGELINAFRAFADNPAFPAEQLCKRQRLFVLAPQSDDGLLRIMAWLKDYGVPIEFVPFQMFRDGAGVLYIKTTLIEVQPLPQSSEWKGDWFFNTNETHHPGSYKAMLDQHCVAVYGYGNSEEMLSVPEPGQRVFFYLNGRGIIGTATFTIEEPFSGDSIFGKQNDDEFHRRVADLRTVPVDKSIDRKSVV